MKASQEEGRDFLVTMNGDFPIYMFWHRQVYQETFIH